MKILNILLFFFLLISCTGASDEIQLYNNNKFKILKGEILTEKNKEELENYENMFSYKNLQLPLFKIILSEHYKIYIGIPYRLKKEVLLESMKNEKKGTNQKVNIENDNIMKVYENENFYLCEYLIDSKNKMVLYFGIIFSKNKFKENELFSLNDISKRLLKK